MDTFQAIIGWKRMGKRENKKLSSRFVPTRCVIGNSKKITKKLKNTIMKSFQAKVGWKRMGKSENKKLSFRFVPTRCVIEIGRAHV